MSEELILAKNRYKKEYNYCEYSNQKLSVKKNFNQSTIEYRNNVNTSTGTLYKDNHACQVLRFLKGEE